MPRLLHAFSPYFGPICEHILERGLEETHPSSNRTLAARSDHINYVGAESVCVHTHVRLAYSDPDYRRCPSDVTCAVGSELMQQYKIDIPRQILARHSQDQSHHWFSGCSQKALSVKDTGTNSRTLYILASRELSPVTELMGTEFLSAWWDCVLCHHNLWEGGIHHCDITTGNLMYCRDASGRVVGVLNDLDLATFVVGQGPTGNRRMGTVLFMARHLLTRKSLDGDITRMYRHQLESFTWVLVWVCLRFHQSCERNDTFRRLGLWLKVDEQRCREKKNDLLVFPEGYSPSLAHKDNWALARYLMSLLLMQHREPLNFNRVDVVFAAFKEGKDGHEAWMKQRVKA
ncbi:hypothetical protein BV22DRAFT_1045258 [Leucogyrophana mollusca]|uniref:Uncharacterized protein n=1 Tax=Leucogyrophana mollusca TaxID=85980 RepID=A0ACB8BNT6_9AGAM|nr:hypothetical protein BV22DRAFT_1045258 [Leucogyrophana mollusca]